MSVCVSQKEKKKVTNILLDQSVTILQSLYFEVSLYFGSVPRYQRSDLPDPTAPDQSCGGERNWSC
jgi:hypothetical protein